MEKERFLKWFSKKMAVIGAIGVTIPMAIVTGLIFSQIHDTLYTVITVSAFTIGPFLFFLYFFWFFCRSMRELGEFWDNLIMYDSKFIPGLKKRYKDSIWKIRVGIVDISVYQLSYKMRYFLPIFFLLDLILNVFFLYQYLFPMYDFPGYYQMVEEFALIYNLAVLSMPTLLIVMFFAVAFSYKFNNFVAVRENDIVIINQINDSLIRNFIPISEMSSIEQIKSKGVSIGIFQKIRYGLHWRFHHPRNGLYVPSFKPRDLVRIMTRKEIKILQYGSIIRYKKPKRFEYVNTDEVLLEMIDPQGFIREVERRLDT